MMMLIIIIIIITILIKITRIQITVHDMPVFGFMKIRENNCVA